MYSDYINTTDLEQHIEHLRECIETNEAEEIYIEDEVNQLQKLLDFKTEVVDNLGEETWNMGTTFVADHHFADYAQEMAESIGAIPVDARWPATHIDWDAAADDLKQDYTEIYLGDTPYWGKEA